ncbi:MAG: Fe-S-containing hydro-lyase [Syntrophomonadaceae bacterium]|nr:Fe-S-containing hydro-lyase [Syntrophomonadaceae bacterium]
MTRKIVIPQEEAEARLLQAGETVLLSGMIYTARDAAHRRMQEALQSGQELPIPIKGQAIYYTGPGPASPGRIIGAAGPTTSGRMDVYTPPLLAKGLRIMIGKGMRSPEVVESMKKYGAVYLAAIGGAGALLAERILDAEVVAYPELGPEAILRLWVEDFPAIVVIDCDGNNWYEIGRAKYRR